MEYTGNATEAAFANPTPDQGSVCTYCLFCQLTANTVPTSGLFAPGTASNPSKVWQIQVHGVVTPVSDDDLVIPVNNGNSIALRLSFDLAGRTFTDVVLPGPALDGSGPLTNSALRVTIIVARDRMKQNSASIVASPFPMGPNASCTVFDGVVPAAQLSGSTPTYTYTIGAPTLNSNSNGRKDSYKMLIAITAAVKNSDNTVPVFTASHDPEMEISM